MRSAVEQAKYKVGFNPAAITASADGNIIDRQGYESVTFVVALGTVTTADAENTLTVSLEASDASDMSGAEAVTSANGLVGANLVVNATGLSGKAGAFGYVGDKRYLRVKVTEAGTASAIVGVAALLGNGLRRPETGFSTFS